VFQVSPVACIRMEHYDIMSPFVELRMEGGSLMPMRFYSQRTRRALALLTALCCFWMSTVGSLQHFHGASNLADAPGFSRVSAAPAQASQIAAAKAPRTARHPAHCLACEWQANSVSAALPAFQV